MADGYIRTEPDVTWWMERISEGDKYRKEYALEDRWDTWRKYYRGRWKSGILPVNIFFSMLRAMVPRIYFRNPAVSITPSIPGYLNMAFAQVLNRIDNKMIVQMGVKQEIKDMVHDAFLKGTGTAKLGYGGMFTPTPTGVDTAAPAGARGEQFEYHFNVQPNMPWLLRTCPGTVVWPVGTRRNREARWVAHWIRRAVDDVRRDPRLENTQGLNASIYTRGDIVIEERKDEIDLVEVRDFKFRRVMLFAPQSDSDARVLYNGPDALQARRLPIFELVFNPDDECVWGIPDAQILEPYQLEMNEIRTQTMKHRRLALVKLLAKRGAIAPEEIAKLYEEEVAAVITAEGNPKADIERFQVANIPPDLIVAGNEVRSDVRETVGFSRNEMGEFQTRRGDTSAEEARNVKESSEIRMDERRDAVADLIVDMMAEMNGIIFDHWTEEQVFEVVGPGGIPVWVKMRPSLLSRGRYHIKVDPDSSMPKTRQMREAKAISIYNLLKTNPFIDPMKLTQYVLRELEGVELDDMMRAMPAPEGGGPQGAVPPEQFAGMLQTGMRQLAAGPPPQIPATVEGG